jgi:site-specific DNA recombinase
VLIDVGDVALGHETKLRWNERTDWVWSQQATHPALVSVGDFEAAQDVFAGAQRAAVRKERTRYPYLLSGLLRCAICGRRMQASWNHGRPYYRCKFPSEYAVAEDKHAKTVYVRETSVVPGLDAWIGELFDDEHFDATCEALAAASKAEPEQDEDRELVLRRQLKECESKLAKYRALLEQQPDITVVGSWIAEVERERRRLERELGRKPTARALTTNEIRALVRQLKDIASVLAEARPEDKRAIYDELGVNLEYDPATRTVRAGAGPTRVLRVGVGGATATRSTRWEAWLRTA